MTISSEALIRSFEELYLIEKKAHDLYEAKLEEKLSDHERHVIQRIHDDEERHMKIVKGIISIVEGDK